MHKFLKRSLAAALSVSMCAGLLSACSKKSEGLDAAKTLISLGSGAAMDTGTANLILRYEQASFENGIGMLYEYYYGLTDIWNTDLYGTGEVYSETFKEEQLEVMERMLLCEAHMEDLGVEITAEEEEAISAAAAQFIADNADYADALDAMTATQETAEKMLRYYTIKSKAEAVMAEAADTEVSDEEAAQRTVSYLRVTATVETEEETEALSEEITEGTSEDGESVAETVDAGDVDMIETETEIKTQSAAETEADDESVAESTGEAATEEIETEEETEGETESAEMIEARAVALAAAEAFLAEAEGAADGEAFDEMAEAAEEANDNAYAYSFTFGDDDTYPDAAIIEATQGLEDNTLVDHVVIVDDYYYVLYVTDAFDEEATEDKKAEIIEERQDEVIEEQYTAWLEEETVTVDETIAAQLLFDMSFTEETEAETDEELIEVEDETGDELISIEDESEALSETMSEGLSESVAELAG